MHTCTHMGTHTLKEARSGLSNPLELELWKAVSLHVDATDAENHTVVLCKGSQCP